MAPKTSAPVLAVMAALAVALAAAPPADAVVFILCGGGWAAPGATCPFFLPPPPVPVSFFGLAEAPGQLASVHVRVEVFGIVIGECSDTAPNFAFCSGVGLVPLGLPPFAPAECIVEGHRQGQWACYFDPPPPNY